MQCYVSNGSHGEKMMSSNEPIGTYQLTEQLSSTIFMLVSLI